MSDLKLLPDVRRRLEALGQERVLQWWDMLDQDGQPRLLAQLDSIDFDAVGSLLEKLQYESPTEEDSDDKALAAKPPANVVRLPESAVDYARWNRARERGRELLAEGRVGAILVAGGQGSRLGFDHPKGMYPIGPVSGHSLFQIFAEQLLTRSRQCGQSIPYFIMTSDATHDETVSFFQLHNNFGLPADCVTFFRQGNMPAVECVPSDGRTRRILLSDRGTIALSPDGHGGMISALRNAGLLEQMRDRGIEHVYYHQVDNPTATVCDPAFIGFHLQAMSDMSTRVVRKRHPDERMGAVVDLHGHTEIIEYSELTPETSTRTDSDGTPVFWAGSTAIHMFRREFLETIAADPSSLPFHLARKNVPYLDDSGNTLCLDDPDNPNALKFEQFIFDALPRAKSALVLEADRAREFNPVKNRSGDDSPETARQAMLRLGREWLEQSGLPIADDVRIEIGPLYGLSADDVRDRLRNGLSGGLYFES